MYAKTKILLGIHAAAMGFLVILSGILLAPREAPHVVSSQSSPVLQGQGQPLESRYAAPLSKNGRVDQRLWIPNMPVASMRIYIASKEPLNEAPSLVVSSDNNGKIGTSEAAPIGTLASYNEQIYQADYPLPINSDTGKWIWLSFTQQNSSTALRLIRQIDHSKYPGGRLIIADPPRQQEQGTLAHNLLYPKKKIKNLKLGSAFAIAAIGNGAVICALYNQRKSIIK